MLIRQKKCLFHGNKLLALPERDPSFFIRHIHAREAPFFSRHQEIIFLALFTVSRLQTRAVGKNAQRRVTGIDQRAVGATTRMVPIRAEAVATALRVEPLRWASLSA